MSYDKSKELKLQQPVIGSPRSLDITDPTKTTYAAKTKCAVLNFSQKKNNLACPCDLNP